MSARKGIYAIRDVPCDGGESPNAYVPKVTAEIRVHFPPYTASRDEVRAPLLEAIDDVMSQIEEFFSA